MCRIIAESRCNMSLMIEINLFKRHFRGGPPTGAKQSTNPRPGRKKSGLSIESAVLTRQWAILAGDQMLCPLN